MESNQLMVHITREDSESIFRLDLLNEDEIANNEIFSILTHTPSSIKYYHAIDEKEVYEDGIDNLDICYLNKQEKNYCLCHKSVLKLVQYGKHY